MGGPLEMIAVDVLGPLPQTQSENVYVLVEGDYHYDTKVDGNIRHPRPICGDSCYQVI